MRRLLLVWIIVLLTLVVFPTAVLADDSASVVVTMVPFTGGITNFTITYVSDTRIDFSWGFGGDATKIMIRGKYGGYPNDIPDENTTPSDGYLVYYGDAVSASDTSMDFDQNPGALYYKAWAQRADDTWHTDFESGWKESARMQLAVLVGLAALLTILALKYTSLGVSIVAAGSWFGVWIFIQANPLNNVTAGSNADIVITVILWGIALMLPFVVLSRTRSKTMWTKDNDVRGRFLSAPPPETGYAPPRKSNRPETIEEYRARMQAQFNRGRLGRRSRE